MKEIFDAIPRTTKNDLILLDTCFIIDTFHNHKEKDLLAFAKKNRIAITSFNVEELIHVLPRKIKDKSIKERVRKFFKEQDEIKILDIPVHPGDMEEEKAYVQEIDPFLSQDVPDPSDAVLVAAAIKTQSIVVTKDKHHLFTAILENYIERWNLKIVKDLKDI